MCFPFATGWFSPARCQRRRTSRVPSVQRRLEERVRPAPEQDAASIPSEYVYWIRFNLPCVSLDAQSSTPVFCHQYRSHLLRIRDPVFVAAALDPVSTIITLPPCNDYESSGDIARVNASDHPASRIILVRRVHGRCGAAPGSVRDDVSRCTTILCWGDVER